MGLVWNDRSFFLYGKFRYLFEILYNGGSVLEIE